jgi:hypothetical protein
MTATLAESFLPDSVHERLPDAMDIEPIETMDAEIVAKRRAAQILRNGLADSWKTRALIDVDVAGDRSAA